MKRSIILFIAIMLCLPSFADNRLLKNILVNQLNKLSTQPRRNNQTKTEIIYVVEQQKHEVEEPLESSDEKVNNEIKRLKHHLKKNPSDANAFLQLGKVYGAIKRYDKAESAFIEAIRCDSSFVEAHYYLGLAYLRMENNIFAERKAVEQYRRLLPLDKDIAKKFKSQLPKGALDSEAVRQAKAAAESNRGNLKLQVEVAQQYVKEAKWAEAQKKLSDINSEFPGNELVLEELTKCELHSGNLDKALYYAQEIVKNNYEMPLQIKGIESIKGESNPQVSNLKKRLYQEAVDFAAIIKLDKIALSQNDLRFKSEIESLGDKTAQQIEKDLLELSEVLYKENRKEEALMVLSGNSAMLKETAGYNFLVGRISLDANKPDKAEDFFLKALEIASDYRGAYFFKGVAESKNHKETESIESFSKAIQKSDFSYAIEAPATAVLFSIALLNNKQSGKSIQVLATLKTQSATVKAFLGEAYLHNGDNQKAQRMFEEALDEENVTIEQANYLSFDSLLALGKLAYKKQNFPFAKSILDIAQNKNSSNSEVSKILALIFSKGSNNVAAIESFEKLIENGEAVNVSDPQSQLNLGVAFSNKDKPEKAIACFKSVLKSKIDFQIPDSEKAVVNFIKAADYVGNNEKSKQLISSWKRRFETDSCLSNQQKEILRGRYYSIRNDNENAKLAFSEAIKFGAVELDFHDQLQVCSLAAAYSSAGNHKLALNTLMTIIKNRKNCEFDIYYQASMEAARAKEISYVAELVDSLKSVSQDSADKLIKKLDATPFFDFKESRQSTQLQNIIDIEGPASNNLVRRNGTSAPNVAPIDSLSVDMNVVEKTPVPKYEENIANHQVISSNHRTTQMATRAPVPVPSNQASESLPNVRDCLKQFFKEGGVLDTGEFSVDQRRLLFERDFKDKIYIVDGRVTDIGKYFGDYYVTINVYGDHYFDIYTAEPFDLLKYKKGQTLVFKGRWRRMGTGLVIHHQIKEAVDITNGLAAPGREQKVSTNQPSIKNPVIPQANQTSTLTWGEYNSIFGIDSKKSDFQKENMWKKYKGLKVCWSGEVQEIRKGLFGELSILMKMNKSTLTFDLTVDLNTNQTDKALEIEIGQTIKVTGILKSYGGLFLPTTLSNGIILD